MCQHFIRVAALYEHTFDVLPLEIIHKARIEIQDIVVLPYEVKSWDIPANAPDIANGCVESVM